MDDEPILVKLSDGKCRECGGQLEIVDCEEDMMEVCCTECQDSYNVEVDAFGDGGIDYWPRAMVMFHPE